MKPNFELIDPKIRENCSCAICGTTKSVKYKWISPNQKPIYLCNKCVARAYSGPSTRLSAGEGPEYACGVCCVSSNGILSWDDSDVCYGVRPFCILNSSILVNEVK